jgi:hypothetical protein
VNEQKYYFVDYKFNYVFGPAMDITDFDEFGYSVVKHAEDTVEVISKEFNSILLPYNCTEITPLSKDFFKIKKKGKIGVIDKNGKCIIAPRYHDIFMRSNNHFELIYSGQHGLADKDGRLVFECMFPEIMETPDKFFVKTFSRSEANKVVQLPKNKGEK